MASANSNQRTRRRGTRGYCRAHVAPRLVVHPSVSEAAGDRRVVTRRPARRRAVLLGGVTSWVLLSAGTVLAWSTLLG